LFIAKRTAIVKEKNEDGSPTARALLPQAPLSFPKCPSEFRETVKLVETAQLDRQLVGFKNVH
jgi:hypothetical protein